jgi:hypothetical protein
MRSALKIGLGAGILAAAVAAVLLVLFLPCRDEYVLRVDAPGGEEVLIDGTWSIGEPGVTARHHYGKTPFEVRGQGGQVTASFRAVGGLGWIRMTLRNRSEQRWGHVAEGEGHWVALEWAKPGLGRRTVRTDLE